DSATSTWTSQELPTLVLDYARPVLNDELSVLPEASLDGLEGGADGARTQWLDRDGEGLPGTLIDSDYAWYYKKNAGQGQLTAPRALSTMPAPASLAGGGQTLEDLGGDGQLDLVSYQRELSGYFSRTTQGGFETLRAFETIPSVDFNDPN